MQHDAWQSIPVWLAFGALAAVRLTNHRKLAERLRRREPKAMGDLYDAYGASVYSLIHRIVGDTAAAEDLTQETFLRIWNRFPAFDAETGALGPWVLAVARSRAVDYLRSAHGRMPAMAEIDHPSRFTGIGDPSLAPLRLQRFKEAFDQLAPAQKMMLELAYYEGLSVPEIAERTQQPAADINASLRSALEALRERSGAA